MRKLFFTLLAGSLILGCQKTPIDPTDPNNPNNPGGGGDPLAVERVQNAFGMNFSGTWCGPCGANGIPALYSAKTTHEGKFHGMKIGLNGSGANDPFYQSSGSQLASSMYPAGENGIPGFAAGHTFFSAGNIPAWRAKIDEIIATPAANVKAGLAITKEIKGDSLIFNVRMKTFSTLAEGMYALTVFVAEDGLVANQAGQTSNPFTHKMVYRGYAMIPFTPTYGVWGHPLTELPAAIAANTTIEKRFGYVKPSGLSPDVNYTNAYAYAVLTRLNLTTRKPDEIVNSARTR